jgi:hypothetical protein
MMVIVVIVGIHLAFLRVLLHTDHFFGFGTIYSERYSENRFNTLRVGMTRGEVEAIVEPPLRKIPWNQLSGARGEEMWYYTDQHDGTANFWRR